MTAHTGHFIAKGDKTSCGGEVLEGNGSVSLFGLIHARMGDPVTCGKNRSCTYQEAQMMQAARQVKATLDDHTPEEAEFLYRHGAKIASYTGQISTWLGVSGVMTEKHLTNLRDTLLAMEKLHQDTFRQHGNLGEWGGEMVGEALYERTLP